jgi:hypothetical protein
VPAKIVAVLTKQKPQYTYATAPGSPVRNLTDLRGKKIGFSQGQAQGLVVLRTLKEQGRTATDVQLVALPSTKFLVALQSKQIDVAPFGALDALTRIKMHELLRSLCARHRPAVLLVTHDVDEAVQLADRVVVLDAGRIAIDLPLDLPAPRRPGDPAVLATRELLLRALGVTL